MRATCVVWSVFYLLTRSPRPCFFLPALTSASIRRSYLDTANPTDSQPLLSSRHAIQHPKYDLAKLTRFFFSPHGIAIPKGLYFTNVISSFFFLSSFFFRRLRSLNGSQPNSWTHIHLWLLFEKFGPNSPGCLPHRMGGQKPLFETDFKLWPKISLQRNTISTIGKNLSIYSDSRTCPINLVNFGLQTAENGWKFLPSH